MGRLPEKKLELAWKRERSGRLSMKPERVGAERWKLLKSMEKMVGV